MEKKNVDDKKEENVFLKNKDMLLFSIRNGLILSLIPSFFIWFQISNQFFFNPKITKLAVYCLTMLVPAIIEMILGAFKIKTGTLGIYMISLIYHTLLFAVLSLFYYKSKNKKKYLIKYGLASFIFLTVSVFLMW